MYSVKVNFFILCISIIVSSVYPKLGWSDELKIGDTRAIIPKWILESDGNYPNFIVWLVESEACTENYIKKNNSSLCDYIYETLSKDAEDRKPEGLFLLSLFGIVSDWKYHNQQNLLKYGTLYEKEMQDGYGSLLISRYYDGMDDDLAIEMLTKACKNSIDACINLSRLYEKNNIKKAIEILEDHFNQNEESIYANLVRLYNENSKYKKDEILNKILDKSTYFSDPYTMEILSRVYLDGNIVSKDLASAFIWAKKSGNFTAIIESEKSIQTKYVQLISENQYSNAFKLIKGIGEKYASPKILHLLGNCYEEGYGIPPDPILAMSYYEKAFENSNQFSDISYDYARLLHNFGELSKSKKILLKIIENNPILAQDSLQLLLENENLKDWEYIGGNEQNLFFLNNRHFKRDEIFSAWHLFLKYDGSSSLFYIEYDCKTANSRMTKAVDRSEDGKSREHIVEEPKFSPVTPGTYFETVLDRNCI